METSLLDILRCPYCGMRLKLLEGVGDAGSTSAIWTAVMHCECSAFPVVAGIPVLLADNRASRAVRLIEAGAGDKALLLLLDLDEIRVDQLASLTHRPMESLTFMEALNILCDTAESEYLAYRFSDPTYVFTEALVTSVGLQQRIQPGPVLDVCGGAGHIARALTATDVPESAGAPSTSPMLADVAYWKLWLASNFVAPSCSPVCCDANVPLPFRSGAFTSVIIADAFHYVWQKRLFAGEIMRVLATDGLAMLPHVHSSLGYNPSAGNPLSPGAYKELFARSNPRLYRDSQLLEDTITTGVPRLARPSSVDELADAPSLTILAGRHTLDATQDARRDWTPLLGQLRINPLYRVEPREHSMLLELTFPSEHYEAEYGDIRRYLPSQLELDVAPGIPLTPSQFGSDYDELRRLRVLLDLPNRYD